MPDSIAPTQAARIRRRLLGWYRRRRRDLPWRTTRDPYAVWLSETMLQQTQVATVIPYYKRFLARFPNIQALAAAPLGAVLHAWAGLGYYARARNLHRAAKIVVSRFAGRIPESTAALRTLPGVGEYTAGAVASIAFGRRAAAVDGNATRVLARLANLRVDVSGTAGRRDVRRIAESLLPKTRCGDFNQALMEMGATTCLPGRAARCGECPVRGECRAHAAGAVHRLPLKKKKARAKHETRVVAAIRRGDRLLVVRHPPSGLWGGLWGLPSAVLNAPSSRAGAREIARRLIDSPCAVGPEPFCRLTRRLTHRTIEFVGHICRISSRSTRERPQFLWHRLSVGVRGRSPRAGDLAIRSPGNDGQSFKWVRLDEFERLGLSRAMSAVVARLGRGEHIDSPVSKPKMKLRRALAPPAAPRARQRLRPRSCRHAGLCFSKLRLARIEIVQRSPKMGEIEAQAREHRSTDWRSGMESRVPHKPQKNRAEGKASSRPLRFW